MSMADNLRFSKHKELKGKAAYDRYDNYDAIEAVSYTHLDVYKSQVRYRWCASDGFA